MLYDFCLLCWGLVRPYFTLFIIAIPSIALAQSSLRVSSIAWQGLTDEERSLIQSRYIVEALAPDLFGTIIDNQSVDRSTPGTNSGSNLGQALASATYVDKALGSGGYSAKNHLGSMLLGGLFGSALDSKPQSQYQFRYAIRLGNGSIIYQDAFSTDPFRHSIGVCVALPNLSVLPEQHICNQTTETLRNAQLGVREDKIPMPGKVREVYKIRPVDITPQEERVSCKSGALPPVTTTREKCQLINGVVL